VQSLVIFILHFWIYRSK